MVLPGRSYSLRKSGWTLREKLPAYASEVHFFEMLKAAVSRRKPTAFLAQRRLNLNFSLRWTGLGRMEYSHKKGGLSSAFFDGEKPLKAKAKTKAIERA